MKVSRARVGLRLAIVPGFAAQCFGERALPLRSTASHVKQLGYEATWIVSTACRAARATLPRWAAILRMDEIPDPPIVLLGYSKGASDVLEASADRRWGARRGGGQPRRCHQWIAIRRPGVRKWLDALADMPGFSCKGGDRSALKSLRRGARLAWLAAQEPSPSIRYSSLVSFAEHDQISSVPRPSYNDLSMIDPHNNGQLMFYDQIVPRSTLLGYLNADHWVIAMPIVREVERRACSSTATLSPEKSCWRQSSSGSRRI